MMKIRKLTIDDYDALIDVWADAGLPYRPFGRDSRERIEREMQREDTRFIGLFIGDRLVGVGLTTYDGRKGWINRVAVDPDYRGQGFASKIIEECEKFLKNLGAEIIACLIEEYNTPSMALFQKHDYLYGEDIHYFSKRKSEDT
ncbi:MAG: GNAT family N-acetyltransferase [candidate division Zixibacteria bacterium]|nr:GNAT family N-acetyltransferase [candidate division Zixibacteria bacterium]